MSSNAEETMAASTYRLTGDALAAANSPESSPVTLPHRPKPGPETEEMKLVPWDESDLDDYGNYDEEVDFGKPEPVKSGDPGEPGEETKPKPKKKKKKSKKGGKGKKKPTGFEEYYVDTPMTPAEHEEETQLYDPSIPAVQRLETAIQRYEVKRRLHSDRRHVFTRYLSYGGIHTGPKMFGGIDPRDIKDMDGDEIVAATAQFNIPDDRSDWLVDFELVAKGFFSSEVPSIFGLETQGLVDMVTGTVKNFLNYILYHKVCPEYEANIHAARAICDLASKELGKAHNAGLWAPGDFNMACATLFGGSYFDTYTGDKDWTDDVVGRAGMPNDTARKVVKFALAGAGSEEEAVKFLELANSNGLKGRLIDDTGFEVLSITPASNEVKDFYNKYAPDLKPVGKIKTRAWRDPALPDEDVAPGELPSSLNGPAAEYEFFVEDAIMGYFFVGMKFDADIWELNSGVHYFDNISGVYCSFYTVLPNDSMMHWKEPRDVRPDHLVFAEDKAGEGGAGDGGSGGEASGTEGGEDALADH